MDKPFQTIVIRNPFLNELDRYRELAEHCLQAGVTHLTFTEMERSYWEIDDPLDPYLQWSIVHTSMVKLFPGDMHKGWVPENYAGRQRELIAARAAILKKVGLKGAAFLYDPLYWPESVFRKYPEYRGPRVDMPSRCVHPRYAPCIDHPDVLAFYRRAFRQLYELSEGVLDIIIMRTNDSATGFCWTNLYNGPNGPEACKSISRQARVNRFLSESLAGIGEAGGKPRFYLGGGAIHGNDHDVFVKNLPEQCGYYSHSRANKGGERIITGFLSNFSLFPLKGLPNPMEIIEKLSGFHEKGWKDIVLFTCPAMYGNDWDGDFEILDAIRRFNKNPGTGMTSKTALLRETAADLFGENNADDLLDAWWEMLQASALMLENDVTHGFFIFLTCLAQRWLTRPLVVFPERLTEAEKAHYKPYLFQSNPRHEALDLLDLEPTKAFDGMKHLAYYNKFFDAAVQKYAKAGKILETVRKRAGKNGAEIKRKLVTLEMLLYFLQNMRNCINFQIRINAMKDTKINTVALLPHNMDLMVARVEVNDILRSEIDNTLRLAKMLEQDGLEQITLAEEKKDENPFLLGPDIVAVLRRKAEIMQAHIAETDELVGLREANQ